ncbi:hypothetical protein [Streptomyces sp. NPDC020489]
MADGTYTAVIHPALPSHDVKDAEPLLDAFGGRGLHRESFMMNSAS